MAWDPPTDGSVYRFIEKLSHSWQLKAFPLLFLSTPVWCHIIALFLLIPALNFTITVLSCQPFPLGTVERHIFQEQAQSQTEYSLIEPIAHSYAPHVLVARTREHSFSLDVMNLSNFFPAQPGATLDQQKSLLC